MLQELVAVRDPYYVQVRQLWTVLCDACIDWVVTGDVGREVSAVAATSLAKNFLPFQGVVLLSILNVGK